MKHGIHIPASVVWLLLIGLLVLIGLAVAREFPEMRRYVSTERM